MMLSVKPGQNGKSLALDLQVRSDFRILGIVFSLNILSPGNLLNTWYFQVAFP